MKSPFIVGLSSWIIQDGNYEDFKRGDSVAFALEFYSPSGLSVLEEGYHVASLERLHSSVYQIVGRVIHVHDGEWWVIDAGILMYREERPPFGVEEDCWVSGEVYIGVDPFPYFETLSLHHTAPGLIYDWIIKKIEIQTAPFIKGDEGHLVRDPERLDWREIDATNAGPDGFGAEYVLHCERLDRQPRRLLRLS